MQQAAQQQQLLIPFQPAFDLTHCQLSTPTNSTAPLHHLFHQFSPQPKFHPNWSTHPFSQQISLQVKGKLTHSQLASQSEKSVSTTKSTENKIEVDDEFEEEEDEEGGSTRSISPTATDKCHPDVDSTSSKDSKRRRTSFSSKQLLELEREFITKKYLSLGERAELARTLKLSQEQIKVWFQNRRAKWKRSKGYRGGPSTADDSSSGVAGAKTISSSSSNATSGSTHKIYVPIPVHVDRVRLRSQQQQIEKR